MTTADENRRRSHLKRNALWLLIWCALSATLLYASNWEANRQEKERMDAFRDAVADIAHTSESIITDRLHEFDNSLLVLRNMYTADPEHFAKNLELLRRGPLSDREVLVVLVNGEGKLAFTDMPNAKLGQDLSYRAYFRYFADGGKDRFYVDEPIFGRTTQRYSIPLVRPIYDKRGRFSGVMALSVRQDSIANFGFRLRLSKETTVTVVTHSGALAGRSSDLTKVQGTKIPRALLAPMLKGEAGVFDHRSNRDEAERIIAYRHLQPLDTPLIVYAEASAVNVRHELSLHRAVLLWGAVLVSLSIMVLVVVYLKGRKVAEQLIGTLRASKEQEYKTLTQTSLDGFYVADGAGRILDVNDALCAILGFSKEELLRLTTADIVADQSPERTAAQTRQPSELRSDRYQSRYLCKDGALIDAEVSVQYVREPDEHLFVFLRDITEMNRSQEQLLESRKQYRNLVEGTSDLITRVDAEGRFLYLNHAAGDIFGLAPEECLGRRAFDFLHPDDKEATRAAFQDWLQSGKETFSCENRQVHIDGQECHHMLWTIRAERDENGVLTGFASTARDITEQKNADQEKARLENQLRQSQKMESVGRLAGGIAHDFNNMLLVILGHANLALSDLEPTQPLYADLEQIRKAGERSAELTRQLLAFARRQTIEPKLIDLSAAVDGMLAMMGRLLGENIALTWQPGPGSMPVKMDTSQLNQILANLCVNARDAIADVGHITIESSSSNIDASYAAAHADVEPGEYVRLSVSDDGCGMDSGTLAQVFEPFFTTKGVGEGTGLGLSTVYGIVKQNKGFVNAYSEPGLGTTFNIYLPRAGEEAQPAATVAAQACGQGQETVLLVEDEPAILHITSQMLSSQGYNVLAAGSPNEAMHLAKEYEGEIHLLMTDVIMPKMSGLDLANQIADLHPQAKRLYMSGYTANVIAHHGVLDEGMHFIQKPFSVLDMNAKVREALGSA